MFSRSSSSRYRAMSANIGEIKQRLRTLEKHLERIGEDSQPRMPRRPSIGSARPLTKSPRYRRLGYKHDDRALSRWGQFVSEIRRERSETRQYKLGNDALRRLSSEVEHRPLVTLAVAGGCGEISLEWRAAATDRKRRRLHCRCRRRLPLVPYERHARARQEFGGRAAWQSARRTGLGSQRPKRLPAGMALRSGTPARAARR